MKQNVNQKTKKATKLRMDSGIKWDSHFVAVLIFYIVYGLYYMGTPAIPASIMAAIVNTIGKTGFKIPFIIIYVISVLVFYKLM